MNIAAILIAILGLSTGNVLLINDTGLKIVRLEIDGRRFEEVSGQYNQILIQVTPQKHKMKLVFKGGGEITWPDYNFAGIHEIIFYRFRDRIRAHPEPDTAP